MICEYERDLNRHYLIIIPDESEVGTYETKMLEKNHIKGILSCQIRYRNGEKKYYFDISGQQSLDQIYAYRKMSFKEFKMLFYKIQSTIDEVERYLLDSRKIVLKTAYIFEELGKEKYSLLYLPEWDASVTESIRKLAENLLDIIDHQDEKTVNAAYHFFQISGETDFTISRLIEDLEQMEIPQKTISNIETVERIVEESKKEAVLEEEIAEEEEEKEALPVLILDILKEWQIRFGKIVVSLLLGLSVLGVYLVKTYVFTREEQLLALAGILTAILVISSFAIKHIKKRLKEEAKKVQIVTNLPIKVDVEKIESEKTIYGETTFFGMNEWEQERVLEGKIKGRHLQIKIEENPFVIGKLEGSVSYILEDNSISRIHAKFTEENGILYLSDLNSKNGTFKNGVQLKGEEKAEVRVGDEINFGRLRFTYH